MSDVPPEARKLDWIARFDRRSLAFLISDNFREAVALTNRQWKRPPGAYFDQGSEGACTGFGAANVLASTPRARPDVTVGMARSIYYEARKQDEWPGEGYDGSSVLGAMKACKETFGYTYNYFWAKTISEVQHGVSLFGPMEIGVNWYEGMFAPDQTGYLNVTGQLAGGHATCLGGIDIDNDRFRLDNSWGPTWGGLGGAPAGSAWLRFEDMDRLLHEQGEAALLRKHRWVLTA